MTRSAGRSRPRTCASASPGTSGAYNQYGFYGDDVSNYVQYVGRHLPEADFRRIESCPEFRSAVNAGDYDYLITTPELDLNNPSTAEPSPERGWAEGRSGRPAGAELGARLGVPDHGGALASGLRQGESAQPPEPTWRISLDSEVSGLGDYILGVLGLVAVVLSMAIAGRTTRRAALPAGPDRPLCSPTRSSRSAS